MLKIVRFITPAAFANSLSSRGLRDGLAGCASWIHIEPCAAPQSEFFGEFWKIFGSCISPTKQRASCHAIPAHSRWAAGCLGRRPFAVYDRQSRASKASRKRARIALRSASSSARSSSFNNPNSMRLSILVTCNGMRTKRSHAWRRRSAYPPPFCRYSRRPDRVTVNGPSRFHRQSWLTVRRTECHEGSVNVVST
jgi:hypothetical protein